MTFSHLIMLAEHRNLAVFLLMRYLIFLSLELPLLMQSGR